MAFDPPGPQSNPPMRHFLWGPEVVANKRLVMPSWVSRGSSGRALATEYRQVAIDGILVVPLGQ